MSERQESARPSAGYRPDIQGLRALAILAVVAAHAGLPFLEGGFVGVDVFFVLSGYLITGLLLREVRQSGKLDLLAFYARRLRRLLPALLFMLACTALASMVLLAPFEQQAQAPAFVAAALWLSNVHFAVTDAGYFEIGSEHNLVLHTWSLSVEEQFYLIWPLLILALAGSGGQRARLAGGLFVAAALSFAASMWLAWNSPLWAFYGMPTRAWQFAVGGLVFLLLEDKSPRAARLASLSNAFGLGGLLLLACSMLLITSDQAYPSWRALAPSLAAAMLILAGQGSGFVSTHVLQSRPMVWLGDISYSWYLWHWPVLVLGGILQPAAGVGYRISLVALSLGLAVLAYRCVEHPARRAPAFALRPSRAVMISLVLMTATSAGVLQWQTLARSWVKFPVQASYQQIITSIPAIYSRDCDGWYRDAELKICSFGDVEAGRTAVLFGDSVGVQWFSAFEQHYVNRGWHFLVMTKSSCPLVDVPFFYERIGEEFVNCEIWRNQAVQELVDMAPDVVLMGSSEMYPYSSEDWIEGTARLLDRLSSAVGRIHVIRGTPYLPFDAPACLARRDWQPAVSMLLAECSAPAGSATGEMVASALHAATARYANAGLLDLNPLVCPEGVCHAALGGLLVFRDEQHVSDLYVQSVAGDVATMLDSGP